MWLILLVMFIFLILDKKKIMQYNTLFMSVFYVLGMPALLAAYFGIVLTDVFRMLGNFKVLYLISFIANILLAVPVIVILCYILFKMCRNPIIRDRFSGDDTQYAIACANRQKVLLWICFPFVWIPYIGYLGAAFTAIMHSAATMVLVLNPLMWIINILSLGMLIPMLLVSQSVLIGAELVFCLGFFIVYVVYLVITLAMTGSLLFRVRKLTGYSVVKNIITIISMAIPLWSLISIISLSVKLEKVRKDHKVH